MYSCWFCRLCNLSILYCDKRTYFATKDPSIHAFNSRSAHYHSVATVDLKYFNSLLITMQLMQPTNKCNNLINNECNCSKETSTCMKAAMLSIALMLQVVSNMPKSSQLNTTIFTRRKAYLRAWLTFCGLRFDLHHAKVAIPPVFTLFDPQALSWKTFWWGFRQQSCLQPSFSGLFLSFHDYITNLL